MDEVNKKAESIINAIAVPYSVTDKQAEIAKKLVKAKMMDNFSVQEFCTSNGISTKTYYVWFENPDFDYYVNQLQGVVIPTDEREAYNKIKKHILKIADKANPSIKEIELFTETFSYVVQADQRERADALGISDSKKPNTPQSLEEKKAVLLGRLKPSTTKGVIDND